MKRVFVVLLFLVSTNLSSLQIPDDRVLSIDELTQYLTPEIKAQLSEDGEVSIAVLSQYFRTKFSERFFYDYKTFNNRLTHYRNIYNNQEFHQLRAMDHMGKFNDSTQWVLPFNYLNGDPVNAYALRHLARQHKMVDIILHYYSDNKDPKYIQYFENQMRSLNAALISGEYEKIEDGNGVYEVFRSGYRIFNWLWIHNMILNEAEYSDVDQLITIATLLQHGQHLYSRNESFRSGNHQTKGMSALALLSILFQDFEGTDLWFDRAMQRLSEHLDKEINDDGFQFERSVHYHMSDINNYYYIYQLAKINNIAVDSVWEKKLKSLFTTLIMVAYPDRSAPVLQDDTEIPWAEKNDISGAMTLGYLMFEDPEIGYFATDKVDDRMYWFLTNRQVDMLKDIKRKKPSYGSLAFEDTHYYIMREGWNENDKMLIVSAGLDSLKPDHQHGDMLGIQAIANGHAILPNYQVRYSLEDFDFFKNSMVKNVALVDDQLQGKQWTSNRGGSGFGKFKELPNPTVISWETNNNFDLFAGSHDGFENEGVEYSRQVVFVKDKFWVVKDNFTSRDSHEYKQVWQGHYTTETGPDLIRATFPDASGVDILQLTTTDKVAGSGTRGKQWTVVSKYGQNDFSFVTVIFPYRGYDNRINEKNDKINLKGWVVNDPQWVCSGDDVVSICKVDEAYLFNVRELKVDDLQVQLPDASDLYIKQREDKFVLHLLGTKEQNITLNPGKDNEVTVSIKPGEYVEVVR